MLETSTSTGSITEPSSVANPSVVEAFNGRSRCQGRWLPLFTGVGDLASSCSVGPDLADRPCALVEQFVGHIEGLVTRDERAWLLDRGRSRCSRVG